MEFKSQIMKLYWGNAIEFLKGLIANLSKYSFLLLFEIVYPVIFNVDFLLEF